MLQEARGEFPTNLGEGKLPNRLENDLDCLFGYAYAMVPKTKSEVVGLEEREREGGLECAGVSDEVSDEKWAEDL